VPRLGPAHDRTGPVDGGRHPAKTIQLTITRANNNNHATVSTRHTMVCSGFEAASIGREG